MSAAQGNGGRGGDLNITNEVVMFEAARGESDVLRVTFTQATTADGKQVAWHSIREFYKDAAGEMRPGKKGITIKGRELRGVTDALVKACGGART